MARKSRVQLRKEVEIADAREAADGKKGGEKGGEKGAKDKKPKRKPTSRRTKEKALQRKRLIWGVYSSSMKEEARFPYDQRGEAEKKVKQLAAKAGKTFFIQPIKELIVDAPVVPEKKASPTPR